MRGFLTVLAFGGFLVGCGPHPDPALTRGQVDVLVEESTQNNLVGAQALLVDVEDPWVGAVGHKRLRGAPLPLRIREQQIQFLGFKSPTLTGVEIIRTLTEELGLDYEIDTSSFYFGSQEVGAASSALADTSSDARFQPAGEDAALSVSAIAPVASEEADSGTSGSCQGEPLRYAARNEGIVEFARTRDVAAVSDLLRQGGSFSPGEVALNNLLTGGLQKDLMINGTPREAFDQVVEAFNLGDWEYAPRNDLRGKVIFRYYVTREFKVALQPPSAGVVGEGSHPVIEDVWNEMRTRLARRVGSNGEISTYCNSSSVEVRAKPEKMFAVQAFLDKFSRRALQTVHIEIDIYQVTSDASDGFKVDLAAVHAAAGDRIPYLEFISGGSRVPFDAGSLVEKGLEGAADTVGDIPDYISSPGRGISGLIVGNEGSGTFLVDLIATAGNSSLQYSQSTNLFSGKSKRIDFTTTTNIDVGEDTNFVEGTEGGQTRTVITEDLVTGIVWDVQASILQDGQILISYVLEINSSNPGIGTVNFESSTSNISDELVMKAGQQLVQTTSQTGTRRRTRSGLGDPDFVLFGGEDTASETLTTFVVVLRPSIIRPNF